MPSVSAMQAMVEAVPITPQVPAVVASRPSISPIRSAVTRPARYIAQYRRQSVQADSRSPWNGVASIGPVTSCTAGMSADAAAINCAGTVLSQPPTSTAASIGCAVSIASVSSAARLR